MLLWMRLTVPALRLLFSWARMFCRPRLHWKSKSQKSEKVRWYPLVRPSVFHTAKKEADYCFHLLVRREMVPWCYMDVIWKAAYGTFSFGMMCSHRLPVFASKRRFLFFLKGMVSDIDLAGHINPSAEELMAVSDRLPPDEFWVNYGTLMLSLLKRWIGHFPSFGQRCDECTRRIRCDANATCD